MRISKKMCNFAANYSVYIMERHWIGTKKCVLRALCVVLLALGVVEVRGAEIEYASINASRPTLVQDTTSLRVQDGWNYLQLPKNFLPAIIAYVPDTAFGPIPSATIGIETQLESQMVFLADACSFVWIWQIEQTEDEMPLIIVEAHEEATIIVMPTIPEAPQTCETKTNTIREEVCEKYNFGGEWRTESGDYQYTFKTIEGCDSIVTLHLTVGVGCEEMDTIYYCKGMNTDHQEGAHWYQKYRFVSPKEWFSLADYMERGESERTLMNLKAAEDALYGYYVRDLTPVDDVIWSQRLDGESSYTPVDVAGEAQWIEAGVLVVRVLFRCGESYTSDFTTDVAIVDATQKPEKIIENGQVIIIRGGERYNVLGTRLK